MTRHEAIESFRQVLIDNGAIVDSIKPDSGIQRVKAQGDKGSSKSFWYSAFTDGGIPSMAYGNFKTGLSEKFHIKLDNTPLTDEERTQLAKKYESEKLKRKQEQEKSWAAARRVANSVINSSIPADPEHPYLVKKHCKEAAKYLRQDAKGNLLIKLYNEKRIVSIQYINKNGGKFFAKGGQLKGAYFLFGDLKKPFDTVYIVEGISTGWTVHTLADQAPTFCAMNASNLINVALSVRKQWNSISIIICADNDVRENKDMLNTGVEAATKAALAVNGRVSIPSMPNGKTACDFNDLLVLSIESQNKSGVNT